jgi:hypothetical protein
VVSNVAVTRRRTPDLCAYGNGVAAWWDAATGKEITRYPLEGAVIRATISRDGDRTAIAQQGNSVVTYDAAGKKLGIVQIDGITALCARYRARSRPPSSWAGGAATPRREPSRA